MKPLLYQHCIFPRDATNSILPEDRGDTFIGTLPFTFDLNTRVYYSLQWNASIVRTFPQKRVRKSFFRFCFQLSISMNRDESFARKSRDWRFKYSTCTAFLLFFFYRRTLRNVSWRVIKVSHLPLDGAHFRDEHYYTPPIPIYKKKL